MRVKYSATLSSPPGLNVENLWRMSRLALSPLPHCAHPIQAFYKGAHFRLAGSEDGVGVTVTGGTAGTQVLEAITCHGCRHGLGAGARNGRRVAEGREEGRRAADRRAGGREDVRAAGRRPGGREDGRAAGRRPGGREG